MSYRHLNVSPLAVVAYDLGRNDILTSSTTVWLPVIASTALIAPTTLFSPVLLTKRRPAHVTLKSGEDQIP